MIKTILLWRSLALSVLLLSATFAAGQKAPKLLFDGKSWWDHVKVLADDSMEGRETGSLGLRKAEAYAVEQLKRAGLEPAGTDGYYQNIKFVQRQIDENNSYAFLSLFLRHMAACSGVVAHPLRSVHVAGQYVRCLNHKCEGGANDVALQRTPL